MLMGRRMHDWPANGDKPPSRPQWIAERAFRRGDVPEVRRFARVFGARAGLRGGQLPDFMLAVNEAAACVTARRPGTARVRLWSAGARVYCEVRGDALMRGDTGGRYGEEDALRRRVLRGVCDYFCVASEPEATRVLLTMAVRRGARDPSGRAGMRRPR
jgi:hypothetical protein